MIRRFSIKLAVLLCLAALPLQAAQLRRTVKQSVTQASTFVAPIAKAWQQSSFAKKSALGVLGAVCALGAAIKYTPLNAYWKKYWFGENYYHPYEYYISEGQLRRAWFQYAKETFARKSAHQDGFDGLSDSESYAVGETFCYLKLFNRQPLQDVRHAISDRYKICVKFNLMHRGWIFDTYDASCFERR